MTQAALVGSVIAGKYSIVRQVGRGAMGAVYEGRHVELDKPVAIKLIDPKLASSGEAVERFRREARAASAVRSEHIVAVFDVGRDDTAGFFMVMELLEGEDLATRLQRDERIAPIEAATIGAQVARALAKAHAAGIVHRDLKPANLFLTRHEDGALLVKVLDFGVSKALTEASGLGGAALTALGVAIGSPRYMSPEQARGEAIDTRTDFWSLGVVLYEMLSGAPPYDDAVHVLLGPPKPLADVAPGVPPAIASIVHALLVHDRNARLSDATKLAQMLREAAGASPSSAHLAAAQSGPDVNPLGKTALASDSGTSTAFGSTLPLHPQPRVVAPPAPVSAPVIAKSKPSAVMAIVGAVLGTAIVATVVAAAIHRKRTDARPSADPTFDSTVALLPSALPTALPSIAASSPSPVESAAPALASASASPSGTVAQKFAATTPAPSASTSSRHANGTTSAVAVAPSSSSKPPASASARSGLTQEY